MAKEKSESVEQRLISTILIVQLWRRITGVENAGAFPTSEFMPLCASGMSKIPSLSESVNLSALNDST
jgi:hypothetical protein